MAVYTHSNIAVALSTTAENADLDAAGFALLTYTNIGQMGALGEYGITTNITSYDTLNTDVSLKAKGISDAGDPDFECARDVTDAGQVAMRAAGLPSAKDSYAVKITYQDGTIRYLRGVVTGPRYPGGRNEDFDLEVYTMGLSQVPVEVAP